VLETVAEYVLNTWPERKTGTIDGVQKNKHINIVTGQTEAFRFNGEGDLKSGWNRKSRLFIVTFNRDQNNLYLIIQR